MADKLKLANEEEARTAERELRDAAYRVAEVKNSQQRRNPQPPFITSTLQQEAFRAYGFSAKRTMALAQQLYEGVELGAEGHVGLITYMRTDSTRVSEEAQEMAVEIYHRTIRPGIFADDETRNQSGERRAGSARSDSPHRSVPYAGAA